MSTTPTAIARRPAHGGWPADALTAALALSMVAAAALGLLTPSIYRDNLLVSAGWRGNDAVTLLVAVPLVVMARLRSRRGSTRAHVLWLGLIDYALYNYLFYLFGSAINAAFLLYVVIVSLATFALAAGLATAHASGVGARLVVSRTAARLVAAFLLLLVAGLGAVHVGAALTLVATGEVPAVVRAVGHPTNVIAALDLWLVVSWSLPAAWWTWQRRPLGLLLATVVTVKGAVYMAALAAATVTALRAGAAVDPAQLAVWAAIGAGCLAAAARLLWIVRNDASGQTSFV